MISNSDFAIPDDVRRTANHLANLFHQGTLPDDLATAIAKELVKEREQCAALANSVPITIEKTAGLMRRSTPRDCYDAIMRVRK